MNWDKVSAVAAVLGLIVSGVALAVAISGTHSANKIAAEALETSRQANNISLGIVREPPVLEFVGADEQVAFDFSSAAELRGDLKKIVTLRNAGKRPIDAVAFDLIGVSGLTTQLSNPSRRFSELPSVASRLDLKSAIQPTGLIHVDMRRYVLMYLRELTPLLPDKTSTYNTFINVVLAPKAIDEPTPAGAPAGTTVDDRRLVSVRFIPAILDSPEADAVLADSNVPHRIFP